VFEKILFFGILYEVSGRKLLRDEQFGFRLKPSTALQLTRLVESVQKTQEEVKRHIFPPRG
jgi:hypothetical protein